MGLSASSLCCIPSQSQFQVIWQPPEWEEEAKLSARQQALACEPSASSTGPPAGGGQAGGARADGTQADTADAAGGRTMAVNSSNTPDDPEVPPEAGLAKPSDASTKTANERRKKRIEIAESNYAMRRMWAVPLTVLVPFSDCERARAQVARRGRGAAVTFSALSTADALLHFAKLPGGERQRVCALNFANGVRVGGGYKTGASAQEEDLCRRLPNLYTTLNNAKRDGFYPFGPSTCSSRDKPAAYSDVLFTPGLVVARLGEDADYRMLPPKMQAKNVAVVTAAAPNVNFAKEVYDLELMYRTVEAVFIAPLLAQPETCVLILGAWGCGAFGGNPTDISNLFAKALTSDILGQLYEEVHFAIPSAEADRNADVFRETLRRHRIAFEELKL